MDRLCICTRGVRPVLMTRFRRQVCRVALAVYNPHRTLLAPEPYAPTLRPMCHLRSADLQPHSPLCPLRFYLQWRCHLCVGWRMPQPSAEMLAKLEGGRNIITNMFSRSLGRAVRRIFITLASLMWIVILSVPILARLLATRGQLQRQ